MAEYITGILPLDTEPSFDALMARVFPKIGVRQQDGSYAFDGATARRVRRYGFHSVEIAGEQTARIHEQLVLEHSRLCAEDPSQALEARPKTKINPLLYAELGANR